MASIGRSPVRQTRAPQSHPLEEAVDEYLNTPPSQRRPIEECLSEFRFESVMAAHGLPRSAAPGSVSASNHGIEEGRSTRTEQHIHEAEYVSTPEDELKIRAIIEQTNKKETARV